MTEFWPLIEKGGVAGLLVLNAVFLVKGVLLALKQVSAGEWVPGRYYREKEAENVRLRAENDAYRTVTLRAVGVAERTARREG